jgi:flagellar hook protein FlgE
MQTSPQNRTGVTMNALDIARSGLRANQTQLTTSAHNTANVNTDGFAKQKTNQQTRLSGGVSSQVDTVSLSDEAKSLSEKLDGPQNNVDQTEEAVHQIESQSNFKQNAQVIRTQDQMQKTLLDITA